jgi:hypothetical protein
MKSKILFVLFLGVNLLAYGQHKCAEELVKQIEEFAGKQHSKVEVVPPRESYHVSVEDLENEKKLSKDFKTLWGKGRFRCYLMSSKTYQNDAILKIYEGHSEISDSLIYELKDEADDNKPSYIDVDFKKSPGKFLLKFQFTEQKAGCVAFHLGIFKDYDYYSQQKD